MKDIRNVVLDMLFEPEETEIIEEAPLTDVNVRKPQPVKRPEPLQKRADRPVSTAPVNARDLIYGDKKTKPATAFFSVDEPKKEELPEVKPVASEAGEKNEAYEIQPNISPIYGVIQNKVQKETVKDVQVAVSQVKKPNSSYLGTVISPIFGYDVEKANEIVEQYSKSFEEDIKEEIVDTDATDELYDLFEPQLAYGVNEDVSLVEDIMNEKVVGSEIDLFEDLFND